MISSPSPETGVAQVGVPASSGTVDTMVGLVVGAWEKGKDGAAEEGFLGVITCWCLVKTRDILYILSKVGQMGCTEWRAGKP